MSYLQSFILGLLQGLTEFLPVSSSGHTLLAGYLLGVEIPLAFELILHLATLLAVIIFYRKSVFTRIKHPFCKGNLYLALATAVTAVIAFLFRKFYADGLSSITLLPLFFALTAGILVVGSWVKPKPSNISAGKSAIIGLTQGLACIPGLSRSGTTISTALILGIDKQEATEFSFLLSIPIVLGSAIIELITQPLVGVSFPVLAVGFITAFISGYFALHIVSKLIKNASLDVFSVYLIALSLTLILFKAM